MTLLQVLRDARACRECAGKLGHEPRPLLAATRESRILIVGQAPGRSAHESGIPWDDRSGERLRLWLGLDRAVFYDAHRIALMPMGFCFPGQGSSGDLRPRPECAPLWHDRILGHLRSLALHIYVGQYPLERYLPGRFASVTEAVRAYEELLPGRVVLPHPSPRNGIWLSRNPWFEREALPAVRRVVRDALAGCVSRAGN